MSSSSSSIGSGIFDVLLLSIIILGFVNDLTSRVGFMVVLTAYRVVYM